MFRKACFLILSAAMATTAQARWMHEKTIDLSADVEGSLKSIAADANGALYLTTYFGGAPRQIYVIDAPLADSPTVETFADPAYMSTNGADVGVDANGNVLFTHDTNDPCSSYIRKYDSSGALVASFANGGVLSRVRFSVNGAVEDRRPRSTSYATGEYLLCFSWGTPMLLQTLDASTGEPVGPALDVGAPTGILDAMHDMVCDAERNVIVGALRGTLFEISSSDPSATLADLSAYDTFTQLAGAPFDSGNSNNGGSWDPIQNLYAFTSFKGDPGTVTVYDLERNAVAAVLGGGPGNPDYLGNSGETAFFHSDGTLYLAVIAESINSVVIFRHEILCSVKKWDLYR